MVPLGSGLNLGFHESRLVTWAARAVPATVAVAGAAWQVLPCAPSPAEAAQRSREQL